ncbi:hypothetical protein [Stenotrophomonas acidaminiphila]|uniref:hypothetical protein n=1 Tax=Stenotrophomonas acidaminiphila TaxID=128780 RepID=UPI001FB0477F|nr:hypothetical protein [Stenotrophomonas acidaminiphila]
MNAHNEQQWPEYLMLRDTGLADDAGGLGQRIFTTAGAGYVKQKYVRADIAAQPAAVQEAVAYLDIGAGGYIDLGSDLSDEQLLALPKGRHALAIIGTFGIDGYVAAPVAAAPATYFPLTLRGLIAYGQVAADPSQRAVPNHMRYLIEQMVPHLKRLDEIESNTPAAPGIDLYPIRCALQYAAAAARENTHTEMAEGFDALIRKIDASLKGTLNEQFGSAEGLDNPKGGSEARDAALNTLAQMFHNSEEMEGPDGMVVSIDLSLWHEALEAYEVLIDGYDEVTLATSAQAQASDAEGRP